MTEPISTTRPNLQSDLADWENFPDGFLLTIAEVAEILRCESDSHVRNAIKYGHLKALRLRGKGKGNYRIRKSRLVEYIEESELEPATARREETSRQASGKPLKHIEANWLPEPSPEQDEHGHSTDGHNDRSSGSACGRGCRR